MNGLVPFHNTGQHMDFHFKLERAKGGYYFDQDNNLVPTEWFESTKTEEVVMAEEIHKKFVEILHPYHDLCAKLNLPKNKEGGMKYSAIYKMLDKKKPSYNPELESAIKIKILEFANKYGMGGYFEPEHINIDNDLEGFEGKKSQPPSLYNLLLKAAEMNEMLLSRKSYETVPPKLKDICNLYSMFMRPQLNGGLYMETTSIFATMYWGMAFTEYTYEVKECAYCQAPLLTDKRAKFCKAPRQCKNNFNNPNRKKKKESK